MTDAERELLKLLAKLLIQGGLNYLRVARLSPDEIETEYEKVKAEFDEFTPDKIGT